MTPEPSSSAEAPVAPAHQPARSLRKSSYDGPIRIDTLDFPGRSIRLARPGDPDRLLDQPTVHDWNRRDDYMPYWAFLWPGSIMLADALLREPVIDPGQDPGELKVLELGCGLGLAGLAALSIGLRVCFSDFDDAPFDFIRRSARENGLDPARFTTRLLDWREPPDSRFDLILGADIIYERGLVPLVANVLERLLTPSGLALISTPSRQSAALFPAALTNRGMTYQAATVNADDEYGIPQNGTLYRIRRENSKL